jgi:hypothetical protein
MQNKKNVFVVACTCATVSSRKIKQQLADPGTYMQWHYVPQCTVHHAKKPMAPT